MFFLFCGASISFVCCLLSFVHPLLCVLMFCSLFLPILCPFVMVLHWFFAFCVSKFGFFSIEFWVLFVALGIGFSVL